MALSTYASRCAFSHPWICVLSCVWTTAAVSCAHMLGLQFHLPHVRSSCFFLCPPFSLALSLSLSFALSLCVVGSCAANKHTAQTMTCMIRLCGSAVPLESDFPSVTMFDAASVQKTSRCLHLLFDDWNFWHRFFIVMYVLYSLSLPPAFFSLSEYKFNMEEDREGMLVTLPSLSSAYMKQYGIGISPMANMTALHTEISILRFAFCRLCWPSECIRVCVCVCLCACLCACVCVCVCVRERERERESCAPLIRVIAVGYSIRTSSSYWECALVIERYSPPSIRMCVRARGCSVSLLFEQTYCVYVWRCHF